MAIAGLIQDQRVDFRRPAPVAKVAQHHFRIKLGDKSTHDVLAANADDARLFVRRRHPRKRIVSTVVIGGKE